MGYKYIFFKPRLDLDVLFLCSEPWFEVATLPSVWDFTTTTTCNLEPQAVNGLFEGIASTMVLLYAFWSLGVKVSLEQNSVFCLLS